MRIAALLLIASIAHAQLRADAPPLPIQIERAQKNLAELRGALDAIGASRNPAVAESLQRLQRQLWEMQRSYGDALANRPPPPPPRSGPQPIADPMLAQLEAAIDHESFSDGKIRVLQEAARGQFFLVAQLRRLVGHYSFSSDQVRAVEIVAPRLLDRQNAFQLYDAFTYSADKKRVEQILSSQR